MNAAPLLEQVARALQHRGLDVVLIGNAAAALQGAPVTTIDIDFMFRKTPANMKKLQGLADDLNAMILQPYYPVSGLYRLTRDEDGMQLNFMTLIDGISSFEGLRKRATTVQFAGAEVLVASLADIIKSKKAAARPRDLAVLEILERVADETSRHQKAKTRRPEEGK